MRIHSNAFINALHLVESSALLPDSVGEQGNTSHDRRLNARHSWGTQRVPLSHIHREWRRRTRASHSLRRSKSAATRGPAELARIYVHLAANDASYVTGNINGAGGGAGQP
jgi:hypothetical protein